MTNGEKYKTAKERSDAFIDFCDSFGSSCGNCPLVDGCGTQYDMNGCLKWLELEYEEPKEKELPLTCPFCGKRCNTIIHSSPFGQMYKVVCSECAYSSKHYKSAEDAISAHNRVANGGTSDVNAVAKMEAELQELREKVAAFGCGSYDEELKRMSVGAFRRLKQQLKDANDCIEEVSKAISDHSRNPNEKKAAKAIGKYKFVRRHD